MHLNKSEETDSPIIPQHCDILRKAAEAGGLLVDAMINTSDGSKENSSSVPLMVVENGCGSPCIDLRQVSSELAAAAKDADLVCLWLLVSKPLSVLNYVNAPLSSISVSLAFTFS